MYFKKPENEWYKGEYYEYDKTQNKLNFKNNPNDYIHNEDYDEYGYITFGHEFRYKQYTDETGTTFPLPNLRSQSSTYVIETSDTSIVFKKNDKIKLLGSDKLFKIIDISYNRKNANSKATLLLPGLYDVYNSSIVITLK